MKIKKVKNFSKNFIYGLIYRLLSLFFPFLIRTFIIKELGSVYLGLSSLFTSILQALNLAELGIGSALVYSMYKPLADGDYNKFGNYLSFYKKCYRIIGIFILVVGLMLVPFLKHMINGTYPSDINLYIVYFIYLFNTVVSYLLFAYKNSVALAFQRNDIESKILIITHTLMYVFQMIFLLIFKNYYLYIIFLPIFTILKNILVSIRVNKVFPEIKEVGNISKEEERAVFNSVKYLFGHQIAFTVINSADSIILSYTLGLNDLAIYNNYYYIFNAVINLFTVFFSSIQAGIGNGIILDNKETVFNNFKNFRLLTYMLVIISSSFFLGLYQPFMKIWMGEELMLNYFAVLMFVIGFYITQIRRVVTTYKNSAGMWKEDFIKPYIVIVTDIILDFILIKYFGSIGVMMATILSMGLIAIPWEVIVLYKKLFKINPLEYLYFFIYETIVLVINLLVINYTMSYITGDGIIYLVIRILIIGIISSFITILLNFKRKEFKWLINRTKSFVANKE